MKKILFLNDSMVLAGTESLLMQLLNHLHQYQKAEVTLLLPYPSVENVLLAQLNKEIKVAYIYPNPPKSWRKKWKEIQMIFNPQKFRKHLQIDLSQYDCCVAFKEGFLANIFTNIPQYSILWVHNLLYHRSYDIHSLKERLAISLNKKEIATTYSHYQTFDLVLCVSNACKKAFEEVSCFKNTDRIKILPNGVDFQKIRTLALSQPINFDHSYYNFVLVTRDSPDKCPQRILEVTKLLMDKGIDNVKFHIIGLTGDEPIFAQSKDIETVRQSIIFYGIQSNPYPYVKSADWSLCVSDRESFSLSVLESMILETPVLTTACGGPEDILENGKYGRIVAKSSEAIAEAIVQIINDESIGEHYKQQIQENLYPYELSHWLKEIENILL